MTSVRFKYHTKIRTLFGSPSMYHWLVISQEAYTLHESFLQISSLRILLFNKLDAPRYFRAEIKLKKALNVISDLSRLSIDEELMDPVVGFDFLPF